jgi:hypothetical protein
MANDRLPAPRGSVALNRRGAGSCALIGLVVGVAVPFASWLLGLGPLRYLLFVLVALAVGAWVGRTVRVSPRAAGLAFLAGSLVWTVIGAGGGLFWIARVLVGTVVAAVAAAAFATAVAWRRPRGPALTRG